MIGRARLSLLISLITLISLLNLLFWPLFDQLKEG